MSYLQEEGIGEKKDVHCRYFASRKRQMSVG